MLRTSRSLAATILLSVCLGTPAMAEDEPSESIVVYRQNVFQTLGKHMKGVKMIVKDEVNRAGDVVMHARGLKAHADILPTLFPQGTSATSGVKTDALPAIWEKWSDFQAAAGALSTAATALEEAGASGDMGAVKAAFGNVGKSCGGCHKSFRKDD